MILAPRKAGLFVVLGSINNLTKRRGGFKVLKNKNMSSNRDFQVLQPMVAKVQGVVGSIFKARLIYYFAVKRSRINSKENLHGKGVQVKHEFK